MTPLELQPHTRDYRRMEQAILFLAANAQRQPGLPELARHVGLSPYHLQRLFRRLVGLSPKRFLQFLTKERAKPLLEEAPSLLEATLDLGLSSVSRLHDLFVSCEAVTPGEIRSGGDGLTLRYGLHSSPLGMCLLAATDRGICRLAFVEGQDNEALEELQAHWPRARLVDDPGATRPYVDRIFRPRRQRHAQPLHLLLRGTNFQIQVWQALLRIPPAKVVSYQQLAHYLGRPQASRAVGQAVARNPLPILIPCHRVVRKTGELGGYRYGEARKWMLLAREAVA